MEGSAVEGWDVIVVGGGSAGSVLAARLSEDPSRRVLLLEAGRDWRTHQAPAAMRDPAAAESFVTGAEHTVWSDLRATVRRTTAQTFLPYRQGSGLGGSSILNGMVALRPLGEDFDRWAALGCHAWDRHEGTAALARLEDDLEFGDQPGHGRGGGTPVTRTPVERWGPLDTAFAEAALAVGHSWCDDLNGPVGAGVGPLPANLRDGRRVTANDAYLEGARERWNLSVRGGHRVDRVLFAPGGTHAVGVRCRGPTGWGNAVLAGVEGEIVLCAGAFHSAAILLRSGIGPAADLSELGIPLRLPLPVGSRVQDHPLVTLTFAPATSNLSPALGRGYEVALRGLGGDDRSALLHPVLNGRPSGLTIAIFVTLLECASVGRMRLGSPDPDDGPQVDACLLSDPLDRARLIAAIQHAEELFSRPALAHLLGQGRVRGPGRLLADPAELGTGDVLLRVAGDAKHLSGSCPMGPADAPWAVVDGHGRVYGTQGLRVADLSVVPTVPRANTYLTALLVGEQVARLMTLGSAATGDAGVDCG